MTEDDDDNAENTLGISPTATPTHGELSSPTKESNSIIKMNTMEFYNKNENSRTGTIGSATSAG